MPSFEVYERSLTAQLVDGGDVIDLDSEDLADFYVALEPLREKLLDKHIGTLEKRQQDFRAEHFTEDAKRTNEINRLRACIAQTRLHSKGNAPGTDKGARVPQVATPMGRPCPIE